MEANTIYLFILFMFFISHSFRCNTIMIISFHKIFGIFLNISFLEYLKFLMGPGQVINGKGIPGDDLIVGN